MVELKMSLTRSLILIGLVAQVMAQSSSSSSEPMFSIQTDPPTPTSSSTPSSSSSSSASDQIGSGLFPEQCTDTCSPLADTFLDCGLSDFAGFNSTCLCTTAVEDTFLDCAECALAAESDPSAAQANYQRLMNAYIQQCAAASTTLPSVTVQLPSRVSASTGSSTASSSVSASASTSDSSSSSTSGASLTSTPSAASSAAAGSSTPSNTASRGMAQAWMWSLTGVGGVVLAAALGV